MSSFFRGFRSLSEAVIYGTLLTRRFIRKLKKPEQKEGNRMTAGNQTRPRRKFFTINKLPLLLLLLMIACFAVSSGFNGKHETIPKSEFPAYGSENQDAARGWVKMEVVSAAELGKGESHSQTQIKGYTSQNSTYYMLFLVEDEAGHQAIYSDIASYDNFYTSPFGSDNQNLPMTIYGEVISFESMFKSFDGYDSMKEYAAYDVIKEYQYESQTRYYVQSDTNRSIQNVLSYAAEACAAGAVISLIVLKIRTKKLAAKLGEEEQKKENERYGI